MTKALGDVPHPLDLGAVMSLPHTRDHARGAHSFHRVEEVVRKRRVKGEAGEMSLAVTMREVTVIEGGSVKVMTDLIEGMIDLNGEGMMIVTIEGRMMIVMIEGGMRIVMIEGEMMIDMIEGEMRIVMIEGGMMIDMNEEEMIGMSEGEMMIEMSEGDMMTGMIEGEMITLTGEEVMIAREMVGLRGGGVKSGGTTTGTREETRTKEERVAGKTDLEKSVAVLGEARTAGEAEVHLETDTTARGMTPGVGKIEAQGMTAEGGEVMEIGPDVEMTVMWGVEMERDGEGVEGMMEGSGARIGAVTGLHGDMIVIGMIEVAMATDRMTERVGGRARSQKRRWMRRASSLSADELDRFVIVQNTTLLTN